MTANSKRPGFATAAIFVAVMVAFATAQNPQLQEKVAQIKESMAANKQALAKYTWQEQQTISLKGEVKKQQSFQVQMGPDGKPQKTPLGPPPQQAQPSGGRLKRHVVEKKTDEFQEYAQQIAALAHSYTTPEPGQLQQAYQQGNVSLSSAGAPGQIELVIHSYVKPGDTVTMVFNTADKALQTIQISSYLNDQNDAVTISAQFAKLVDGTNHVSNMLINGVSKQLTVNIQNTNYQPL